MNKIAIIGHTGFVGEYIHRIYPNAHCFNSKNIQDIDNKQFDMVICCGVSATKWLANKNPEEDLQKINELTNHIQSIKSVNKFILISTIDVYSLNSDLIQNETSVQPQLKEPYGKHRYELELNLKQFFSNKLTIIRLGALFGFGLKKNLLFDIIQKSKIIYNPKSRFQWYSMQWFEQDLKYILDKDLSVVNLFVEPLSNYELFESLKHIAIDKFETNSNLLLHYDIKTQFSENNTCYWRSKNASLEAIKRFMNKICTNNSIVVSSLTNPNPMRSDFGITDIEVAPFSFFGPDFMNQHLEWFLKFRKNNIYSFQGLFYPYDWKLDIHFDEITKYLCKLIDIAFVVGVKILVFGSPKLRSVMCGASRLFTELMQLCNDYIGNRDIYICVEPNAKHYNCNFLTTAKETSDFIRNLNLPKIKMMLDTGNMWLENESEDILFHYASELYHIHFSAPNLIGLNKWEKRFGFAFLRNLLIKKYNYKHRFTIECLNITEQDLSDSLYLVLKDPEFSVIGAGWFGCHISNELIDQGFVVDLYEKEDKIFTNVSSHNQNRLHLGFHYPRSSKTRYLCQSTYNQFVSKFSCSFIESNCYYISNESCIDFDTYKQIMQAQGLTYDEIDVSSDFENLGQKCLQVTEGVIDFNEIAFKFELQLRRFITYKKICLNLNEFGHENWLLDCTYNELQNVSNTTFEHSLLLIYKQMDESKPVFGLTVMDGPFFSLYPYDIKKKLYTLTHVSKGRTKNYDLTEIETDIQKYYPNFLIDFELRGSFISKKCLMDSSCASRELLMQHTTNKTSVICGKITGIFEFQKEMQDIL